MKMGKIDLDIGNIFYIVITIVAVILGLVGRKKRKPSASPSGSSESGKAPGFMENLENILKMGQEGPGVSGWQEEETGEPQAEEYMAEIPAEGYMAEIPEEEPEPELASEKSAFMQEYEHLLGRDTGFDANRILETRQEDMEKLEVVDLDAEEGPNYFEIIRDFDAATAVIYAAIINRIDY
jgi:hypothetical protein